MLGGSFPLGRIAGIPIRMSYLFPLFLVLQMLGAIFYGPLWIGYWFLILGPILLATVLIHELGHCFAARRVGGFVDSILLWPLGGLAFIGHDKGPKSDLFVAVAGPMTHVPQIIFWLLMQLPASYVAYGRASVSLAWPYLLTSRNFGFALCIGAVVLNISLLVFNLFVPAYPLDGGRIFVDALLMCGVKERSAAIAAVCVTVPLAVAIIVLGAIRFQMVTILVGVWILWAAWQLFDCIRKDQLAQHPLFAWTAAHNAASAAGGGGGGGGGAPAAACAPAPGGGGAAAPVNPFAVQQQQQPGMYRPPPPMPAPGYPAGGAARV